MNFLDYEPRQDLGQLKLIFPFMKGSDGFTQMTTPMDSNIHTKIGVELGDGLLQNMNMTQAGHEIDGHGRGTIVLLGPTSMPYPRIFGLVDVYRRELVVKLVDYYRSPDLSNS